MERSPSIDPACAHLPVAMVIGCVSSSMPSTAIRAAFTEFAPDQTTTNRVPSHETDSVSTDAAGIVMRPPNAIPCSFVNRA